MRTVPILPLLAVVLMAPLSAPVRSDPPLFVPPRAADPQYEWAQEFPVTPAFADWTSTGILAVQGQAVGEMWMHRDSLRWHESRGKPVLWADVLVRLNGSGYSRRQLMLSCDATRIYMTRAGGEVTIDPNGAIRPASALTGINGYQQIVVGPDAWFDQFCFDREFQARFLAR